MNLITVLGLVAGAFTTFAFLPQAIKTIKTKQTSDISLIMYIIINVGVMLWLTYGILRNDLPVILANGIVLVFTLTILGLKIRYK
jgi:MtN3 and saliva related transmembrane protein